MHWTSFIARWYTQPTTSCYTCLEILLCDSCNWIISVEKVHGFINCFEAPTATNKSCASWWLFHLPCTIWVQCLSQNREQLCRGTHKFHDCSNCRPRKWEKCAKEWEQWSSVPTKRKTCNVHAASTTTWHRTPRDIHIPRLWLKGTAGVLTRFVELLLCIGVAERWPVVLRRPAADLLPYGPIEDSGANCLNTEQDLAMNYMTWCTILEASTFCTAHWNNLLWA